MTVTHIYDSLMTASNAKSDCKTEITRHSAVPQKTRSAGIPRMPTSVCNNPSFFLPIFSNFKIFSCHCEEAVA